MKKSLIVAMSQNGIIGKNGKLPWAHLPGDLPRFKKLTMGKPCIMGRKTFESLKNPLPGRLNIIVSRHAYEAASTKEATVCVVPSVLEAWILADETGCDEAFVIGGAEVYKQALPSCDKMYLTIVNKDYDGDAKLELSNLLDWTIVDREYVENSPNYQNLILKRERPTMVHFLNLERLPDNHLPFPRYETPNSAGLDFAACLTRQCKIVKPGTGQQEKFWAAPNSARVQDKPTAKSDELSITLSPEEAILVPLGFKCSFGNTCVLKLYARSSVGLKGIVLANGTGIIDPDYRGELFAALINRTSKDITIKHGERVVQGVLTLFSQGIIKEDKVDETTRGEGGFGSTGKMASSDLIGDANLLAIQMVAVNGPPPVSNLEPTRDENEPASPKKIS